MTTISAQSVLFTDVSIFDGTSDQLITGQNVLVKKNLVSQVGSNLQATDSMVGCNDNKNLYFS